MTRSCCFVPVLVVWAMLAGWPAAAGAHPLSPSLLQFTELGAGHVEARWRTPAGRPAGRAIHPVFPPSCRQEGTPHMEATPTRVGYRLDLTCNFASLVGRRIGIAGLEAAKTSVVVRIRLADGRRIERLLTADEPTFLVPAARPLWSVACDYTKLGIEHIASGRDHLLFVLALVLLTVFYDGEASRGQSRRSIRSGARRFPTRRITAAVSAFTAGHSVTLSAAFLGYVRFPSRPIEVGIALSIAVLAAELAGPQSRDSLLRRRPWTGAFAFGLLHGFGFAGALSATGLPPQSVPFALASFNVGIEIGQLIFVALVLAVLGTARMFPARRLRLPALATASGYGIGIIAASWTLSRLVSGP